MDKQEEVLKKKLGCVQEYVGQLEEENEHNKNQC